MGRIQRQIEQHRKGTVRIQIRDHDGQPCAGVPVWAEQQTHAFRFGCIAPDLAALSELARQRCGDRLAEVFNRLVLVGQSTDPDTIRYDVPEGVPLGRVRVELDRIADAGQPVTIHVGGRAIGLDGAEVSDRREHAAAERVAALYTLCFAHPAVDGIVWHGFWDGLEGSEGGGLLRRDLAPRPAFHFLRKLVGTVWHSRAGGETDAAGLLAFRGFFGDYRIAAQRGVGAATIALISCRPGAESEICNEPVWIQSPVGGLAIADVRAAR